MFVEVSFNGCVSERSLSDVISLIGSNGYAIVSGCYGRENFIAFAKHLGKIQAHVRADVDGIVGDGKSVSDEWKEAVDEYVGTFKGELHPHTDGAYLNGLYWQGHALKRVLPPALVAIQCVEQAGKGGDNILVDLEPIVNEMRSKCPHIFKLLSTKGSASFCRDKQFAVDVSIFEKRGDNRIYTRYTSDRFMYLPDWSKSAVRYFHDTYIQESLESENCRFSLSEGQVLLIDNARMLHSRTSFQKKRKIRRLWINNFSEEKLTNLNSVKASHRCLDSFRGYLPVENTEENKSSKSSGFILSQQLGIRLKDL